jgi:transposase
VNARHTKTLPGRKTDVLECQWFQKLHTLGLLNNSFRPAVEIRVLRTYLRQRENHVAAASKCIQHMQKTLTQMNVQLANAISDISGATGMAILRAIVAGERDPDKLASRKNSLIRATRAQIVQSLEGDWREDCCLCWSKLGDLRYVSQQDHEMRPTYRGTSENDGVKAGDRPAANILTA